MEIKQGHTLQDRYHIVRPLGSGGMGAVYLAQDLRLAERQCAVKVHTPIPGLSDQEQKQLRQQFAREAEVLANLDHPNLARVTDYFSEDGHDFLVMDYVAGQNLLTVAQARQDNLSSMEILGWIDQVLKALAYLHRQEPPILHRDIKPANIILTPLGLVKLVDFGLVKQLHQHTPHTVTGMRGAHTPGFAPPEQFIQNLGHTDARSDIYAVGATLYNLLTGTAPAPATERLAEPKALIQPKQLNPNIPPHVEKAVLWSLSLRPEQRPQNAREMRVALGLTPGVTAVPLQPKHTDSPETDQPTPPSLKTEVATEVLSQSFNTDLPAKDKWSQMPTWLLGVIAVVVLIGGFAVIRQLLPKGDVPITETPLIDTAVTSTPSADQTIPTIESAIDPTSSSNQTASTDEPVPAVTPTVGPSPTPFPTLSPRPTSTGPSYWPELQPITINNITNLTEIGNLKLSILTDVSFSPDGSLIGLFDSSSIRIFDTHSMAEIKKLDIARSADSLAFSPNGRLMAAGINNNTVSLWQTDDWQALPPMLGLKGPIEVIGFSPDSLILAAGTRDGVIYLWRMGNGQLLTTFTGHTDSITSLTFSKDGKYLISGAKDNRVRVWNMDDGSPLHILTGHTDDVTSVAVGSDGQFIASGSGSDDTSVRLWRLSDGELFHIFYHQNDDVRSLSFSPDSSFLAMAGLNETVYVWQVKDKALLTSFEKNIGGYTNTFFHPNGNLLAFQTSNDVHFLGIPSE